MPKSAQAIQRRTKKVRDSLADLARAAQDVDDRAKFRVNVVAETRREGFVLIDDVELLQKIRVTRKVLLDLPQGLLHVDLSTRAEAVFQALAPARQAIVPVQIFRQGSNSFKEFPSLAFGEQHMEIGVHGGAGGHRRAGEGLLRRKQRKRIAHNSEELSTM